MCNAILTFVLVFANGYSSTRTKYLTHETAVQILEWSETPAGKASLKAEGVEAIMNMKIKKVKDFVCSEGPK